MTIDEVRRRSDLAVVIADGDGMITEVNARFETLFGWSRDQAVGLPLTAIIPPVYHDAHHLGVSRFLATGVPTLLETPIELMARDRDGRTFPAEHFIVAERIDDAWCFAATIRPYEDPA